MPTRAIVAVADLLFSERIADAARSLGFDVTVADTPERLATAFVAGSHTIVVIDLHAQTFDPVSVIADAKATGAAVLAFGRHTEPATLRAARTAGADRVVPRSQLVEELPQLLASLASGS